MELDDRLAALAAGELDDDTARALRARAASDPAIARRLRRHERLQALLTTWDAPPLGEDARARLDAAVDAALADLGDGPLAERAAPRGPLAAVPEPTGGDSAPAASATAESRDGGDVTDLAAARARRQQRRGLPAWLSGTAVAAGLLAVLGVGVVVGGGLGGDDGVDVMADSATGESADAGAADDGAASSEAMDAEAGEESAAMAPSTPGDLAIEDGELLALLDTEPGADAAAAQDGATDDTAAGDEEADEAEVAEEDAVSVEPDACVVEALERDTETVDGREVTYLAAGTYAGDPAQFVVVRSPAEEGGDRYDVLAYDPADCSLLDRDGDVR